MLSSVSHRSLNTVATVAAPLASPYKRSGRVSKGRGRAGAASITSPTVQACVLPSAVGGEAAALAGRAAINPPRTKQVDHQPWRPDHHPRRILRRLPVTAISA